MSMTQNDINNLSFLMNADQQTLKNWYASASMEDLIYATELLDQYEVVLENELLFAKIDKQISAMPVMFEAQAVIAAVRDLT
jgi:hypothetical protein